MTKTSTTLLLFGILCFAQSCQKQKTGITKLDQESIIDSAKTTVQKVFDASNNLKFLDGLQYYSGDSDTYYINNGELVWSGIVQKRH
jgi:hypothetical protein